MLKSICTNDQFIRDFILVIISTFIGASVSCVGFFCSHWISLSNEKRTKIALISALVKVCIAHYNEKNLQRSADFLHEIILTLHSRQFIRYNFKQKSALLQTLAEYESKLISEANIENFPSTLNSISKVFRIKTQI